MSTDLRSASFSLAHKTSHVASDHFLIHSHPFYELYYFLSGDVRFIYAGTEYVMRPHTLVVVAPNVFHGIQVLSCAAYERLAFHFTQEIISADRRQLLMGGLPTEASIRSGKGSIPCIVSNADSLGILPLMLDAEKIIGMPQDVCETMASVILEALLGLLMIHEGDLRAAADIPAYCSDCQELRPVLAFIHQNLTEKLTLDALSRFAHLSKSKLNHLFRAHLGTTVMDYVSRRRLNYARQLLINGCSAAQAGAAAGFGDYTSFYRAYIKQMGHSPGRDRRTVGKNPASIREAAADPVQGLSPPPEEAEKPSIWSLHASTTIGDPGMLADP